MSCLDQAEAIEADVEKRCAIWQMTGTRCRHEILLEVRVGPTSDPLTIPYFYVQEHPAAWKEFSTELKKRALA